MRHTIRDAFFLGHCFLFLVSFPCEDFWTIMAAESELQTNAVETSFEVVNFFDLVFTELPWPPLLLDIEDESNLFTLDYSFYRLK